MNSLLADFLAVVGSFVQWFGTYLVPANISSITILHVAIWTPVVVGLVALTTTTIQRMAPRRIQTVRGGRPAPAPPPLEPAKSKAQRAKAQRKRRRRNQTQEAKAQQAARRTVERAQAATTAAQAREEAKAQRAAQRAVEQAQAAQAREEAKAQRAAQRAAERAQAAEVARQAREEAKAQRAAQRAAERAQAAEVARQAREEAKAQRAAQRAAERAQAPPRAPRPRRPAQAPQPARDPMTRAFGSDPNRVYEFRYRVVPLESLITSNTDSGAVNPAYDSTLQPRQRQRAASQRQIEQVAKNLVPESLLWDFRQLDKGAPIVGGDLMVESGNGRALALRKARQAHPEQWARYQNSLRENLAAVGLAESDLAGVESPVLVRERVTDVDRAAFAREANAPPVLQMSTLEVAIVDSQRITGDLVGGLAVREGQSIDQALRTKANSDFVRGFIGTLSENEAALLQRKDGTLAQSGIRRIKAALFVRTFEGESGERLAETFLEALDSDIKNFETALSASLPVLSKAENRITSGERAADISMADDFSRALNMLARLRESEDLSVDEYLEQSTLFERETTPFQDELIGYFDEIGRSPKKIREFFGAYAAAVEDAPDPSQLDLFGDPVVITKEQIFERITKRNSAAKLAA